VLIVTKGREHAETAPKRSDARGADVLVRVSVPVRDHLWGEGARGAVVSNCMCARTRAAAPARDHTWSKMVESMSRTASSCAASCSALAESESAWGGVGQAPW